MNASRDEYVETGDESFETGNESMEARDKTQQSCYNRWLALIANKSYCFIVVLLDRYHPDQPRTHLVAMHMSKPGMNLLKPVMNPWKPGKNTTIIL